MRRIFLLLCVIVLSLPTALVYAGGGEGDGEILRRSEDSNPFDANPESYPGGPTAKAPLSTGYYVFDNDPPPVQTLGQDIWTPSYSIVDTTGANAASWRRVVSGPNQRNDEFWEIAGSQGLEYFRNPNNMSDSTDNAFAGPIAIGFPFYYYGKAYDSFYVSTNGLIALSNRRYQYGEDGGRIDYNPFREHPDAVHAGGATADPAADDYGYRVVALNSGTTPTSGILNPTNTGLPNSSLKAIIAPLWDDCELSQYDSAASVPDDFGRVYWRRDVSGNKLIIYYVNLSMKGMKNIPVVNIQAMVPRRVLRASFQVVLDRTDSSVQINYQNFLGQYIDPIQRIINIPSNAMFRANATIGIQSHDQEYTNYGFNDFPALGAILVNGDKSTTPHPGLAIKFKQWKNVVRVLRVSFQVPNRSFPDQFVDLPQGQFPDNFELLLGHPVLGVVRPVGIVQSMTDSIGPVNRTPQPIRFQVIFRIRDLVNITAMPVYQKTTTTDSLWSVRIAAANAARPNRDTIIFEPYFTNAQLVKEIGRFRAEVIATDRGPNGEVFGDQWPFDDTTGVRLFGIARQEVPYITTFNDFSYSPEDGIIPSVRRWVSIGAQVVDGDQNTYSPPPPRGPVANGNITINSPVVVMDRTDVSGAYYVNNQRGVVAGDTLISFPVNVSSVKNPVLVLSYQRAGRLNYPRGWSDQVRLGPEHATYNTLKTGVFADGQPDMIMVEFAEPSPNGVDNITNAKNWRDANFNDKNGAPSFTQNSPRWAVFGGGGGTGTDTTGKIQVNEFDAGKDFQFHRAYIPIPGRWTNNVNTNKFFRFRLRVAAKNDQDPLGPPADDSDPFYLDNIMVTTLDKPEIEVTAVGADWPYTIAPASQARAIPLFVKVSNNGSTAATSFGVALSVQNLTNPPANGQFSYYRYRSIVTLGAGRDKVENFPTWNAQECGTEIVNPDVNALFATKYRIGGQVLPQGYDSYNANDVTYEDFDLTLGPVFAYDDTTATNNVQFFSGLTGKGLNLIPTSQDGNGLQPFGAPGGSTSGSFAVQFRILTRDTIRGFQAYYGSANSSPDYIMYSIHKGTNNANAAPDTVAKATIRYALRGQGIPTDTSRGRKQYYFDQYVTYRLDTFFVVDPGLYFVNVSQLGQTGLELGGNARRQGQVTTIRSDGPPRGIGNYSVPAHPEMRQQRFWYETTAGSGGWSPMLTTVGNPGYPHLNWTGVVTSINTYSRGSWIPMIRPYFGNKEAGACTVEPVELASFEVTPLTSALRLDWATATEIDNHGFYVERRMKGAESDWKDLTFAAGAGTTNTTKEYNYTDEDVVANVTYEYRLRQEDRDGSVNYSGIREGRIASAFTGAMVNKLEQNTPNPFSVATTIGFTVVESGNVDLTIFDVHGNTVRTFTVDAKGGQPHSIVWDGTDANGVSVPNGVYMYKLSGNGFSPLSQKLTVAR